MGITEIILLIIGGILFVAGFVIPEKKTEDAGTLRLAAEKIKEIAESSMKQAREDIEGLAEEAASVVMERTERSLEKLSNEKMMAVSEYSDTVLQEINHNHEEVMFLYDMLSDKQEELKNSVYEVSASAKEALENATDARIVSQEADELVQSLRLDLEEAKLEARDAKEMTGRTMEKVQALYASIQAAEEQPPVTLQAAEQDAAYDPEPPQSEEPQSAVQVLAQQKLAQQSVRQKSEQQPAAYETASVPEEEAAAMVPEKAVSEAAPEVKKHSEKKSSEKKGPGRRKAVREAEKDSANANMDIQFAPGDERANNNELILSMHKQGKSNMAIAKELGLGLGEVKLVIDLFEGI